MTLLAVDTIADLGWRAGWRGEALVTAVAVALAESKGDPDAVGDVTLEDATWGPSIGLWQIRSLKAQHGTGGQRDELANHDPAVNAAHAYAISSGGTTFRPWSTFTGGQYKGYLGTARPAAANAEGRKGGATGVTVAAAPPPDPTGKRPPVPLPYGAGFDTVNLDGRPLTLDDLTMLAMQGGTPGGLRERILSATLDLSLLEVDELTVTLTDPGLEAFATGLVMPGMQVNCGDLIFVASALEVSQGAAGEQLVLTCHDLDAEFAQRNRTQGPTGNMPPGQLVRDLFPGKSYIVEDFPEVSVVKQVDNNDPAKRLETDWDLLQRLAKDAGAIFHVGGGIALFARPTFVAASLPGFVVKYRAGQPYTERDPEFPVSPLRCPQARRVDATTDAGTTGYAIPHAGVDAPATIVADLPAARATRLRPGMRLEQYGLWSFDGPYLTTKVHGDLAGAGSAWQVTAETPIDPTPAKASASVEPGATSAGPAATTSSPSGKGTKLASDFVAFAQSMAGHQYVYGATPSLTDPSPGAFDCSSLVQWAAAQTGIRLPRTSGQQYAACAAAPGAGGTLIPVDEAIWTRGALLFRGKNGADHVAISLGDGATTIEARGHAYGVVNAPTGGRQWDSAGMIPGMTYQSSTRGWRSDITRVNRPS